MRIIDLSLPVEPNAGEPVPVEIERISHRAGADLLGQPAGLDHSAFPDGLGLSLELVRVASHAGTHVDAPSHYGPLCEGRPARNIDELPLEWFFGEGLVIDCSDGEGPIDAPELEQRLAALDRPVRPHDIVLLATGADRAWGTAAYFTDFRGVTREATRSLVERGVKVIGVDSFGFDPPFPHMLAEYQRTGDRQALWPAHFYGREREYCQIERLAHLDEIPVSRGFKVACFPIKLKASGAAWSRVVALVDG